MAEAISSYLAHEKRSPRTAVWLARLLNHFGTATLDQIDQLAVDKARKVLLRANAGPATVLRALITPLRAVMVHAHKRGLGPRPAFDVPKQPAGRVAWLTPAQARALVTAAADHLKPLLVFLLGTGARLGEAMDLDWQHVDLAHARVEFVLTKSGRPRRYTMPPSAVAALANLPHRDGKVFLRPVAERRDPETVNHAAPRMIAYRDRKRLEGGQIRAAWVGACKRAGLGRLNEARKDRPFVPTFTPHDLRHTWATWHHVLHRDLLRLRDDGDWASVAQVETYAHLAPAGLAGEIEAFWGISRAAAVQVDQQGVLRA